MVLTLLINLPVRSEVLACWSDPLCVPWPGCEAADDALSASPVRLSSSAGRHELLITLNTRTKTPLWATTDEEDLLARVVKGSGSATKLS